MSVHPLSQAEADRACTAQDRADAKKRKQEHSPNVQQLAIDLRNCNQRIKRNHDGAGIALRNWFEGERRGLVHYEKYAERIQIDVWKRGKIVADLESALAETTP